MEMTQSEAKRLMDERNDIVILDVRGSDEFFSGHIKNAINISIEENDEAFLNNLKDKNQMILVYCRSGHRAGIVTERLLNLGYKNVYNFGGVFTWEYGLVK